MISSNRLFPRSHHFQTSQDWKPQLQLFRMYTYITSSARMDLKQARFLDLLRLAICLKRALDSPKDLPGWFCSNSMHVVNRQTEQESPDEEYGKRDVGIGLGSVQNLPLPPPTHTNTVGVENVNSSRLGKRWHCMWGCTCIYTGDLQSCSASPSVWEHAVRSSVRVAISVSCRGRVHNLFLYPLTAPVGVFPSVMCHGPVVTTMYSYASGHTRQDGRE